MDPLDEMGWVQRLVLNQPTLSPEAKAMILLLRHLTPEQQGQVLAHNYFDMRSARGTRGTLRLHNVHRGFVEVVEDGVAYCTYLNYVRSDDGYPDIVPVADETLTRKLLLEANPEAFFAVANPIPFFGAARAHAAMFATPGYVVEALRSRGY